MKLSGSRSTAFFPKFNPDFLKPPNSSSTPLQNQTSPTTLLGEWVVLKPLPQEVAQGGRVRPPRIEWHCTPVPMVRIPYSPHHFLSLTGGFRPFFSSGSLSSQFVGFLRPIGKINHHPAWVHCILYCLSCPENGNQNSQKTTQVPGKSNRTMTEPRAPGRLARCLHVIHLVRCPLHHGAGSPARNSVIGPHPGSPSMSFHHRAGFRSFCMVYIGERQSSGANGRAAVPGEKGHADPLSSGSGAEQEHGMAGSGLGPETARPTRSEVGPGSVVIPAREEGDPFR